MLERSEWIWKADPFTKKCDRVNIFCQSICILISLTKNMGTVYPQKYKELKDTSNKIYKLLKATLFFLGSKMSIT